MFNGSVVLIAIVCVLYMDLDSSSAFYSQLLPGIAVLCVAWLTWFRGFVAVLFGSLAVWNADMTSTSVFESIMLPLFAVACLIYLLYWIGFSGAYDFDSVGSIGGGDSCDNGGDGGGCGD